MKMKSLVFLVLLIVFLTCNANASDPWLDEVISFEQPPGSSNDGGIPTDALGPPDAGNGLGYVSIDIPETLIVAFTDNSVIDGVIAV